MPEERFEKVSVLTKESGVWHGPRSEMIRYSIMDADGLFSWTAGNIKAGTATSREEAIELIEGVFLGKPKE